MKRDIEHDLGGYILIAENKADVDAITIQVDLLNNLPEYVDQISCSNSENYTSSLVERYIGDIKVFL
jgi:hypothetical protein